MKTFSLYHLVFIASLCLRLSSANLLDGNFLFEVKSKLLPIVRPFDPIYYIRLTALITNGAYDALAPYHATALGIYSSVGKRPLEERTVRNKNTAIAYATVRILSKVLPSFKTLWEGELTLAGLDPNDVSMDLSTPVGIGNFVAQQVLLVRENDGMNQNGDVFGNRYNRRAYEDCVNYRPKNDENEIAFPNSWQPKKENDGNGVFRAQVHICPHYGVVRPYSFENASLFETPVPYRSFVENYADYVNQTDEVLFESYTLNDRKKMLTEFFADKVWSLDFTLEELIQNLNLDLDQYIYLQLLFHVGLFDAGIVIWKEKIKHDAIRPFSTIRYLYENTPLKAWGGVGVGPVDNIKGKEWKSYLRTPEHTEYPSASTAFCTVFARTMQKFLGNTDTVNYSVTFPKGSSKIEPGVTPVSDVTVNFSSFSEIMNLCGLSRLQAGVHFMFSIEQGETVAKKVTDVAYDFITRKFNGLQ